VVGFVLGVAQCDATSHEIDVADTKQQQHSQRSTKPASLGIYLGM
jgi:hypothetical protein